MSTRRLGGAGRGSAVPAARPWRTAVLAGMASYVDAGALVATGSAIGVLYAPALGLDADPVGLLLGLQTAAFAVGALCVGRWGDRFGRRRVLTCSLVLYALGAAALGAATGPLLLHVGWWRSAWPSGPTCRSRSR